MKNSMNRGTTLKVTALLLGLALGGCAPQLQQLKNDFNALTGAVISPTVTIVTAESFDAAEATATLYVGLPRCNGKNGPLCSQYIIVKPMRDAVRSGRVARNNLKQFLRDHPGQLGPSGLYDALTAAAGTLESIITTNNIRSIVSK